MRRITLLPLLLLLLAALGVNAQELNKAWLFEGSLTANRWTAFTNSEMSIYAVQTDDSGYTYLTGQFKGDVDFDPGPATLWKSSTQGINSFNHSDGFLMKVDTGGNVVWAHTFGDTRNDAGVNLQLDDQGNIYLLGTMYGAIDADFGPGTFSISNGGAAYSNFIAAYQPNGNFLWAHPFVTYSPVGSAFMTNGDAMDIYQNELRIALTFRGYVEYDNQLIAISGTTAYSPPFVPQHYPSILVASIDMSNGNLLWNQFAATNNSGDILVNDLASDSQGNCYVVGDHTSSIRFDRSSSIDPFHLSGGFIWELSSSGGHREEYPFRYEDYYGQAYYPYLHSIDIRNDRLLIGGSFAGDSVDLQPGLGRLTIANSSGSGRDGFLVELDTAGQYVRHLHWIGSGNQIPFDVQTDAAGNIYTVVKNTGSSFLDPDQNSIPVVESTGLGTSTSNILLAKFNAQFVFEWGGRPQSLAPASETNSWSSTVKNNRWLIAGWHKGTTDFDPFATVLQGASQGLQDGFVLDVKAGMNVPTCSSFGLSLLETGNYQVRALWNAQLSGPYQLQLRSSQDSLWTSFYTNDTSLLLNNRAPGMYEFRVVNMAAADTSCIQQFSVNCATDITYTFNAFQAPELGRLGRVRVFGTQGGKRLYDIHLVNEEGDSNSALNVRQRNYTDLPAGDYSLYVRDDFGCEAVSVGQFTINAMDTNFIPSLINAPNNPPNGFRPTWHSVAGVINYQLRVVNVTDGTLQLFQTGINDTMYAVTNLPTGKLYRFNVRSRYNNGVANVVSGYSNAVSRNLPLGGNKGEPSGDEGTSAGTTVDVTVYPNPTKGILYVQAPEGSTLTLIDMNGKAIAQRTATGVEEIIDMTELAQGVYLLEVNNQGQLYRERVVKQ